MSCVLTGPHPCSCSWIAQEGCHLLVERGGASVDATVRSFVTVPERRGVAMQLVSFKVGSVLVERGVTPRRNIASRLSPFFRPTTTRMAKWARTVSSPCT